jgi:hypothetical protein
MAHLGYMMLTVTSTRFTIQSHPLAQCYITGAAEKEVLNQLSTTKIEVMPTYASSPHTHTNKHDYNNSNIMQFFL